MPLKPQKYGMTEAGMTGRMTGTSHL